MKEDLESYIDHGLGAIEEERGHHLGFMLSAIQ